MVLPGAIKGSTLETMIIEIKLVRHQPDISDKLKHTCSAVLRKSMFAYPILGFCNRCPQSLCYQMLHSHPIMLSCPYHDHRESLEVTYFGCCISIPSQLNYHQSQAKDHTKMAWPHLLDLGAFHHGYSILCSPLYSVQKSWQHAH